MKFFRRKLSRKHRDAIRRVRTPEGAKRFGVPVGTPITAAKAKKAAPKSDPQLRRGDTGKPKAAALGRKRDPSAKVKRGKATAGIPSRPNKNEEHYVNVGGTWLPPAAAKRALAEQQAKKAPAKKAPAKKAPAKKAASRGSTAPNWSHAEKVKLVKGMSDGQLSRAYDSHLEKMEEADKRGDDKAAKHHLDMHWLIDGEMQNRRGAAKAATAAKKAPAKKAPAKAAPGSAAEVNSIIDRLALPKNATHRKIIRSLLDTYEPDEITSEHVDAMAQVFREHGLG